MLRNPSLCAVLALHAGLLVGCALTPEFPADPAAGEPFLSAVDALGEPMALDRLPRRPRLSVALGMSPSAPNNDLGCSLAEPTLRCSTISRSCL